MMKLRKFIFWIHLPIGIAAGAVILNMALSGVLLAFEPQIVDFAERHIRNVTPGIQRLSPEMLMAKASEAVPEKTPSGLAVMADPSKSVMVSFGREIALYVNPYTGEVLGGNSTVHNILHKIEEWHRWLGMREGGGKSITGAACLAFFFMLFTGFFLWWPRKWSVKAVKAVTLFDKRLTGKQRDWNWHNVIGFWCMPIILMTTVTGIVMSYEFANNLLYRLTGNEIPPAKGAGTFAKNNTEPALMGVTNNEIKSVSAGMNILLRQVEKQVPDWVSINVRLPQEAGLPVMIFIQEKAPWWVLNSRSMLSLNASTGEVVKWEPFAGQNLAKKIRSWMKPLHTGQAGGLIGQGIVFLSALGTSVLIWTGFALAWRRFRNWRRNAEKSKIRDAVNTPLSAA
jgi:uncharacterized iron-regulated membrane protein